jgi:hypothetical protein
MKRTRSSSTTPKSKKETSRSKEKELYMVSGCVCNTGQGYEGCSCPCWVEVERHDYERRHTWNRSTMDALVQVQTKGRIVQCLGFVLKGDPCLAHSKLHDLLKKTYKYREVVTIRGTISMGYLVNGSCFFFNPQCDLAESGRVFDIMEGASRSTVNAVVIFDASTATVTCLERKEGRVDWEQLPAMVAEALGK